MRGSRRGEAVVPAAAGNRRGGPPKRPWLPSHEDAGDLTRWGSGCWNTSLVVGIRHGRTAPDLAGVYTALMRLLPTRAAKLTLVAPRPRSLPTVRAVRRRSRRGMTSMRRATSDLGVGAR